MNAKPVVLTTAQVNALLGAIEVAGEDAPDEYGRELDGAAVALRAALPVRDLLPGCPPDCTNDASGNCPRCFAKTGLGCGHGAVCDDCAADVAGKWGV